MASCAMPAAPGMNIKTDTPLVKKAREGVMEFLLVSSSEACCLCACSIIECPSLTWHKGENCLSCRA